MNKIIILAFFLQAVNLVAQPASLLNQQDDCGFFAVDSVRIVRINPITFIFLNEIKNRDTIFLDSLTDSNYNFNVATADLLLINYDKIIVIDTAVFEVIDTIGSNVYADTGGWIFEKADLGCFDDENYPDTLDVINNCFGFTLRVDANEGIPTNETGYYYSKATFYTDGCRTNSAYTLFFKVYIHTY